MKERIKLKSKFEKHELEALEDLRTKLFSKFSSKQIGDKFLDEILDLLHASMSVNEEMFIGEILFDFHISIKKIDDHKKRIYTELATIDRFKNDNKLETHHFINIYRNIVSDIFDPYLTLLVAAIKCKESTFINYIDANLGQGERNKYEFVLSRMKPTDLFDGYSPIVRNAISHAGSDSISITREEIIFKDIKRENPPKVKVEKWTHVELQTRIIQLLNFINAIDLSIEIILIDILEKIKASNKLYRKFIDEILTLDQRLTLQEPFDSIIEKIKTSDKITEKEKLDALTNLYFIECKKRNIEILKVGFSKEKESIICMIPYTNLVTTDDFKLYSRFVELIRYGIVAEVCYRDLYKKYAIIELDGENEVCKIIIDGKDLHDYNYEKCGILDILNDAAKYLAGSQITINVDFGKWKELDDASLERKFPSRQRKDNS